MTEFTRLRQAIASNDWDTIASLSHLLEIRYHEILKILDDVLVRRDITMTRLVGDRCRYRSPFEADAIEFVMWRGDFKMAVILHKSGFIIHEHAISILVRRSTNLRFIDWAMKNCKPPLGKEFIHWIECFETDIEPRILRHLIYRSSIQRYLDKETIDLMENVLQKGLDDLPRELIHEICEYLFLCPPSSQ